MRSSSILIILIACFAVTSCAFGAVTVVTIDNDNNFIVNGRPFFPFGMNPGPPGTLQWRDGTSGFAELAKGGINFYRTFPSGVPWTPTEEAKLVAQLDQAEQYGMYAYLNLRELSVLTGDPITERYLRHVVSTYKNRGVLFWKNMDEPCWGDVSIPGLIAGYNVIKSLDQDHPVLMSHAPRNEVAELREYCVACDVTGCDIYPVSVPMGKHSGLPNKELSVVGDYVNRMEEVVYSQKPIVMVLQCTYSGVLPPNILIRPTFYQQRYMTYQAIICGAKGLAWFGWDTALNEEDTPYGWNWTYWVDVLKPLLAEIAAGSELNRVITAPTNDRRLTVTGAPDVEYIAREFEDKLYLLASKREAAGADVTFSGIGGDGKAEALFENRTLDVVNGSLTDHFEPNEVHVYRLFDPRMESAFDQDTVANPGQGFYPPPADWSIAGTLTQSDKCHVVETSSEFAPEPADPTLGRCVKFHDPAGSSSNVHLYRDFSSETDGIVTAQFDVRLKQTDSAFLCRLCNDGVVTSGSSWATSLIFEGNSAWATGGGPGKISYQTQSSAAVYANSGVTYEANKWYTVRVEANVGTRKFRVYFGLRGKPLKEITPYGGQSFIKQQSTGQQVGSVSRIAFATSSQAGDADGVAYVDNVRIEGPLSLAPAAPPAPTPISAARLGTKGLTTTLENVVVTAGTDQLGGAFFYVQNDHPGGAGIRVRVNDGTTVHEGDRVSVTGRLVQASDNGIEVSNNGEREIIGTIINILSSGNPVPAPVFVRCADVGGGLFGDMEYISSSAGYWPQLKGVWPYSQWGSGIRIWDSQTNSYPPLFNVGTLVTVSGVVTQMCRTYPWGHESFDIYVDDGSLLHDGWYDPLAYGDESNHPRGVRIRLYDDIYFMPGYGDITGAFVRVTGVTGAISSSNLISSTGTRNVGLVRPRDISRDLIIVRPAD